MYQIFRCRLPVGFNKHLHCHLFYRLRGQMLRCNLCNSKENKLRSVPNLPNFTRDQLTVAAIEFKLEFVKIRIAVWQQEIGVFFFSFFLVDFWGMTCDLMEGSFYEESDSQISCIELKIWLAFRRHFISHMKSCPFTNRNSRCLLNATGGGINPPGFRMRRKFRGKSLSWSFQANLCKST